VATWQERPAVTQAMVGPDRPPGADPGPPNSNSERPHFGIIDHGWKLVRKEIDPDTVEELFEHPVDALNQTNIIKSEGHAARTRTLSGVLAAWKTRAKAAELPSDDSMVQELSSEELRRLRALGYVGGTSTPKTNPPSSKTNAPGASATTNQTVAPATGTVAGTNALKKEPAP